ncbi:hypothetical protein DFH07DRAFT_771950 [Mycena maculata]|uniref:Uncharacterized protein n=1 Tax=Mycena maculata TaxID=230809 RepID=A0AAD7NFK1_9AGAR|nr:hypothetical protein DFH07DRAFT_771950 [Mycena maculata]
MAPKPGFRRKGIAAKLKVPPKTAPGKICHRCTREIPLNQSLLQHDRICRANTRNRQALIDHVRQTIQNRAESSNDSEAGTSAMDIDDIIQLPTHQIQDLMESDNGDLPAPDEDTQAPNNIEDTVPISLPSHFIFVKHHPHANKPNEIIALDSVNSFTPLSKNDSRPAPLPDARPWAPFKTYSDYKFASRCVRRRTPNSEVDEDLRDFHSWAFSSDCFITFRNHRDMEKSLAAARLSNIPISRV